MDVEQLLNEDVFATEMLEKESIISLLSHLESVIRDGVSGDIVEFGCHNGRTSLLIAKLLNKMGSNKKLYVYDSFDSLPKVSRFDISAKTSQFCFNEGGPATSYSSFVNTFQQEEMSLPIIHKGYFNEIPESNIPSNISFAFLDGDLYGSIIDSLNIVYPRLSLNGKVIIDDYSNPMTPGVKKACSDFFALRPEKIDEISSAYTPVPGGVGPMTINTLILHTMQSAKKLINN